MRFSRYWLAAALMLAVAAGCGGKLDASFSPSVISGPAPLSVEFAPVASDEGLTYRWDFGDASDSADARPTHLFKDTGDFTVALTVSRGGKSGVTSRMQVRVESGPAGWVAIRPAEASLKFGDKVQFEAQAFDELGNAVPDAQITWAADPDAGEITAQGLFTAMLGIGTYASGITASFERLGKTGQGAAPLTLQPGPIAGVRVDPDRVEVMAGSRITIAATATDANGLPVKGGTFTFEALRSADRIDNTGLFRAATLATEVESDLIKVSGTFDGRKVEKIVRGKVTHGVLDRLVVAPEELAVPVKGQASLSVVGMDRFGNRILLDEVKWTLLNADPGQVDATGLFRAGTRAGDYKDNYLIVQGTKNKVSTSAAVPLVVTPGTPASLEISPGADSVPAGAGSPFKALLKDEYGNLIEGAPLVWEAAGGGRITANGVFVAGLRTGPFPDAVRVTLPPRAQGNRSALTATASVTVRQRSADVLAVEAVDADGGGIVLIDLATAALSPLSPSLAENKAHEFAPNWTADGARVVFGGQHQDKFQIFDVDVASGKVRRLTDDPAGAVMPAISPDGKKLAFVSIEQEAWQVYVADLSAFAGGADAAPVSRQASTRVTRNLQFRHLMPRWSPDGKTLAYTSDNGEGSVKIVLVNADGADERTLTQGVISEGFFGWSRDGALLLAGRDRGDGGFELITINLATGARRLLADLPFPVLVASWSPDDSEVALVDAVAGAMWLMDSDGTGLRQALPQEVQPRRPAWRPVALKIPAG